MGVQVPLPTPLSPSSRSPPVAYVRPRAEGLASVSAGPHSGRVRRAYRFLQRGRPVTVVKLSLERLADQLLQDQLAGEEDAPGRHVPADAGPVVIGQHRVRVHGRRAVASRDVAEKTDELDRSIDVELAVLVRRLVVEGEAGSLQGADGPQLRRLHAVRSRGGGDLLEQVAAVLESGDDAAPPRVFSCSHDGVLPDRVGRPDAGFPAPSVQPRAAARPWGAEAPRVAPHPGGYEHLGS